MEKLSPADTQEIIDTFSYTEEEQATFGYLRKYMEKIEPSLHRVATDAGFRKRFMTMGLFLTYRAFNHMGINFSTDMDPADLSEMDKRKIELYLKYGLEPFDSTAAYLKKIPLIMFFPASLMARHVLGR